MKQIYESPMAEIIPIFNKDILTVSTDNIQMDDFDIYT